jgi:GMP synthase (glutamine-hydrolysing)
MKRDLVLVVDFGGQYNQLIARRVRECGVYCEIIPYDYTMDKIKAKDPKGIIFTGGANSVYGEDTPTIDKEIFKLGVPILGICYGDQLMAHLLGGKVSTAPVREYGKTNITLDKSSKLFDGIETDGIALMSHTDYIQEAPEGFKVIAIQKFVLLQLWKMKNKSFMEFNSTQRLSILSLDKKCYKILYIIFVD